MCVMCTSHDWQPFDLLSEKCPDVARIGEPDTLPEWLISMSEGELQSREDVFSPRDLPPGQYVGFWVSCPLGIERVKLAATVSVLGGDQERYVSSEWLEMPSTEELSASKSETRAYFEQQARRREGRVYTAEGTED